MLRWVAREKSPMVRELREPGTWPVWALHHGESQGASRLLTLPPRDGRGWISAARNEPAARSRGGPAVSTELPAIVAEYIAAVNALDTDRIVATFVPDAYVNDNRREIWGTEAKIG